MNEAKQLVIPPQLAHANATEWASAKLNDAGTSYTLTLDTSVLSNPNITRLCVVLYRYGARGPVNVGSNVSVQMDDVFSHSIALGDMQASALIAAEFYQRAGQWKVRALAETSAYGLAALGRRMGMEVDESSPFNTPNNPSANPVTGQAQPFWLPRMSS
ncbi:hypothetical protein [Thiothrix subterranea]|uniref:hypothetical protein n=1 Tax=Thiothrix subterranea TaxID=2735563 RepID=UPI00280BF63F|nr:hypothetical protein [Thiothrix subterranea]